MWKLGVVLSLLAMIICGVYAFGIINLPPAISGLLFAIEGSVITVLLIKESKANDEPFTKFTLAAIAFFCGFLTVAIVGCHFWKPQLFASAGFIIKLIIYLIITSLPKPTPLPGTEKFSN